MREWIRRLGRGLLAAVEIGLASLLLLTIAALGDLSAGVERGAYDPEATSGFAIGFLLLWAIIGFGLLLLLAGHAAAWTLLLADGGLDDVRAGVVRIGAEFLLAIVLVVGASGVPDGGYESLLAVSAVMASVVFVHVAVSAIRFTRRVVTAR